MALEYTYVINPTGQIDNHILREMFEDIKVFTDGLPASGGGAPEGASYLTLGTNATLTDERVLTAGTAIQFTDNGAGSTLVVANTGVTSITGTANQVIASGATGAVTLSLPQSIATSSNVEFNRLKLPVGAVLTPSLYFDAIGSVNSEFGIWINPVGGTTGELVISIRDTDDDTTFNIVEFSAGTVDFFTLITTTGNIEAVTGNFTTSITLEETGAGTDKITIQAPSSIAAAYTLTLPTTDGDANQVLTTDGSGVLSWSDASAGANTALSNLASVAINTALVSDTNITDDLGTSSIKWRDIYARGIVGTTTNDNAQTGSVGEYVESVVGSTNFPATGVWGDLTSISLTAGDWDVNGIMLATIGTTWSSARLGISQTAGNSTTGLTLGSNFIQTLFASTSTTITQVSLTISGFRISLSGTTTIYLKFMSDWSSGTPAAFGRLSARRLR